MRNTSKAPLLFLFWSTLQGVAAWSRASLHGGRALFHRSTRNQEGDVNPQRLYAPSVAELDQWVEDLKTDRHQRLRQSGWLGEGGMGIVDLVQDKVLHRG